jgi:CheY-like chemotaxis protein/DNA-binding Xre family transcriptional regulator
MPEIATQLGNAIRSMRNRLGISQEELAGRAGLHRTYISDIERGARNISLESIERLAAALQTSIQHLFSQLSGPATHSAELVDILVVEDDPQDLELTLQAFASARITNRVHVVRDGAEALDFMFATGAYADRRDAPRPQVVLLDLKLPKVSGLEVLRRLKSDRRTEGVPVVVLTASQKDRDIAECRRLGANNYIIKPVNFDRFSLVTPRLRFRWALLAPEAETASSGA